MRQFGYQVHIYGDGKERNNLSKLIRKNNLEDIVFLQGATHPKLSHIFLN
jgi:hypothetical protein